MKYDKEARRADYMAGRITHSEFYLELSDAIGLTEGIIPKEATREKLAEDKHLNNVRLSLWDSHHPTVRTLAARAGIKSWSLSETVCCLKEMARRKLSTP